MVRGIGCNEVDLILKEYDIKFINTETKSKNRTRNIVSHSAVVLLMTSAQQ